MPGIGLIEAVSSFSSKVDHQRRRSIAQQDSLLGWQGPNVEVRI
jgi:hypothetical protein